jgi:hypothetical protein
MYLIMLEFTEDSWLNAFIDAVRKVLVTDRPFTDDSGQSLIVSPNVENQQ